MRKSNEEPRPVRVGVFDSIASAERAFQLLTDAGFTHEELTVICDNQWRRRHFPDDTTEVSEPESASAAASGGAIGALLGGLTGAAGLATVAGAPFVVAGAMAAALSGGVVGGLTGVMMQRGFEKEAADFYNQAVSDGKILISIEPVAHDQERLDLAERLLREAGAEPLSLMEG